MPYVPVPKDLSRVKTKIAFGLTRRQLICFGIAAAIGIPTYLFTRPVLGTEGGVFLMMLLMLPFFFLAMYEKDGQPAEKVLRNILRCRLWPGKRIYRTANIYDYLEREGKIHIAQNQAAKTAGPTATAKHPGGRKK